MLGEYRHEIAAERHVLADQDAESRCNRKPERLVVTVPRMAGGTGPAGDDRRDVLLIYGLK